MEELDGFPQPTWTKRECSKGCCFKSGTVYNPLFSEKIIQPSPGKMTQEREKKTLFLVVVFAGCSIFYSVSLQLCISFCSFFCLFVFFCWMSCLISVQERRRKKTGLLSVSVCVLCRDSTELRTQQKLTVESFTLKKRKKKKRGSPFCCR